MRFALTGRSPKIASSIGPSVAASMSPTTATLRLSRAMILSCQRRRSSAVIAATLSDRPFAGGRIGMAAEDRLHHGAARDLAGVALARLDAGEDLRADALDRLGVETRLGQRQAREADGLAAMLGQRLERAARRCRARRRRRGRSNIRRARPGRRGCRAALRPRRAGPRACWRRRPCPPDPAPSRPRRRRTRR